MCIAFIKYKTRLLVSVLAGVILLSGTFVAGTQNALITGSVYDQSGVALRDATVRLINATTGFSEVQTSDTNGIFTFPSVPPAPGYILSAEARGFATDVREDLEVNVGDTRLVEPPFVLSSSVQAAAPPPPTQPQPQAPPTAPKAEVPPPAVLAPAPSIVAKAAAPPPRKTRAIQEPTVRLDLVSSMLSGVIDSQSLHTLPLKNRDFLDLALLLPGTYSVEQGSALEGASLVVDGTRADMNNFLLDGVDNNDYTINQSLPFQIVEAMQEFRVQASTSPAEYGRNGGAQINSISRSGSNAFHGTLFEFNRNSALSSQYAISAYRGGSFDAFTQAARISGILVGPFDPKTGLGTYFPTPVLNDPGLNSAFQSGRDPHFNQNQFGANLGGPIAKNRAFFFFNWETSRAADNRPVFERVPDNFFRNVANIEAITGEPALDPNLAAVNKLLNLYPVPNVPKSKVTDAFGNPLSDPNAGDVTEILGGASGAFAMGDSINRTNSDNFLGRLDFRISSRLSMSFKHNLQDIDQVQGGSIARTSAYPGNGILLNGRNQNFSYNLVGNLTPRVVNEARLGWNRFRLNTLPEDYTLDPSTIFQNLNFTNKGLPTLLIGGFGATFGPYASLGAPASSPSYRADGVYSGADNLSVTRGRHAFKLGGEIRHNRLNLVNDGPGRGLVSFYDPALSALGRPQGIASIARVSPAFGGGFDRNFNANSFNWFIQDAWRPRSNVSINLGVRHEVNTAPVEARDRLVNDYPGVCSGVVCLMQANSHLIWGSDGALLGTAASAAPRAGFDTAYNDFGPHAGFAWDPTNHGRTVFRAGYSLTFDQIPLEPSANMLLNPPFVQQAISYWPFSDLAGTFPAGFPLTSSNWASGETGFKGSLWFAQPYSITARDRNTRTPYVHQFHAGIQQRLGNRGMFEIDYVGALGRKLLRNRLLLECTADTFSFDPFVCPPKTLFGSGALSDSVVNQETSGNSTYHSLQARLDTRSFHGLTAHVQYAWAHSMDNASSPVAPVFLFSPPSADLLTGLLHFVDAIFGGSIFPLPPAQLAAFNNTNPALSLRPGLPIITTRGLLPSDSTNDSNFAGERGNSDFDVRHRGVVYFTYDLPKVNSLRSLGDGWQLANVTTIESGQPFSVFGDFFGVPLRPTEVSPANIRNGDPYAAIDNALPTGCNNGVFTCLGTSDKSSFNPHANLSFRSGSLGRNTYFGPGLVSFDLAVLKNTYFGHDRGKNLQFRAECFNLLNHANYLQPFSQAGQFATDPFIGAAYQFPNPFFGQILQARDPREFQFAIKFMF